MPLENQTNNSSSLELPANNVELFPQIDFSLPAAVPTNEALLFSKERVCLSGIPIIVGVSKIMRAIETQIRKIALFPWHTTLIMGETGTGKELFARVLHALTMKGKNHPFMAVNCAAVQDTLFESELFGHERGSFTDAREQRVGKFEAAGEGTIFLDEIGDLSPNGQAKLLRVLNGDPIYSVGGNREIKIKARVIAATNRNLEKDIQEDLFRKDLYYRITEFVLKLPPLEEHMEDIPNLTLHFMEACGKSPDMISADIIRQLMARPWPGNVRELGNCMRQYAAFGSLPSHKILNSEQEYSVANFKKIKRDIIQQALKKTNQNKSQAAKLLDISRATLHRYIR